MLVEQKLSFEPELNQLPKDAYNQPLESSTLPAELSKGADVFESTHTHPKRHTHIYAQKHTDAVSHPTSH